MLAPWLVVVTVAGAVARSVTRGLAIVSLALMLIVVIMPGTVTVVDQRTERQADDQRCCDVVIVMSTGRCTRQHQCQQAGSGKDGKFVSDLSSH